MTLAADVPAIVQRAAQLAAADHRGVVAYRIHQTSRIHASFYHRTDDVLLAVVFDGDRLVRVQVLDEATDGRPAGAAAKAALARKLEAGRPADGFAVPFDARHFAEYRYHVAGRTVQFTSLVRDAHHGDGTFTVDAAGDVVRMEYRPDVLPRYASAGTIVDERAQVLPGFWATLHERQHYDGRYGPIYGSATVRIDESGFQRFADVRSALAALSAGRV